MISNYWKNKLEEEKSLESLKNLYKDEVMKCRLSKAAKEQYYSTIYKPITEKIEETIEPLEKLKKLSEEQLERMLPAPPVPPAIVPPPISPAIEEPEEPIVEEVEDEFVDAPEQATGVEEEGAVGGVKAPEVLKLNPDKGLDIEDIRKRGFKLPSEHVGKSSDKELKKAIQEIGTSKEGKANITKRMNKIKDELEDLKVKYDNSSDVELRQSILNSIEGKTFEIEDLDKKYKNLEKLSKELDKMIGHKELIVKEEDRGLDIEDIRNYGFKKPSEYNSEELDDVIKNVDHMNDIIKIKLNKLYDEIESLRRRFNEIRGTDKSDIEIKKTIDEDISIKNVELEYLRKSHNNLGLLSTRLKEKKVGKGVGRRLYKIKRNGQYGSSYIDIPLLKKRKILRVVDGYGNPLLNGKINKDFVDLITKRFNSKKKYKGSSIEAFKLLKQTL